MINIDELINSIAEATAESIRNWDIQRTIEEVRNTPEIIALDEEIKNGRAILSRLERSAG